ncbi:MAG TPA: hypothetical protein EYO79_01710 [Candidatus Marinimicrobia bacterium]|nr:hypothetical protein [Candidatus Neomarinimicrobiota bacterium]
MVIKGELTFPGDKSISHRSLMFAALANGESRLSNSSTGVDVQSTRKCLEACGIKIWNDGNDVIVKGGTFSNPSEPLDCGNSGTTTRLLLGLLAGQGINATGKWGDLSLLTVTRPGVAPVTTHPADPPPHPLNPYGPPHRA